jgi:hypothetical protein
MAGIKGRSGRVTTAEQKEARAAAGRASHGLPPNPPPLDPEADDPVARLGRPITWGDELKRAQVEGERTQNRRRQIEVERAAVELERARDEADEARGKLIPRKDLEAALSSIRDAWWRSAQVITSDLLAALPGLPIEAREQVRRAADAAIIKAAERVVSELTR